MAEHPVSLIDGPRSGTVEYVDDPWPRYGYVNMDSGEGYLTKYKLSRVMVGDVEVWQGVWVPPGTDADADDQITEGAPGNDGPAGPQGPVGPAR